MSKPTQYVDIFINGKLYLTAVEERQAIGHIISPCISMLKYMPSEAIKEWIIQSCDMMEEISEGKDRSIQRKINSIKTHIAENKYTQPILQQIAINIYLSSMGMGVMSGFGYGATGKNKKKAEKRNMNPEFISTYQYENRF